MLNLGTSHKNDFLEQTKAAREERQAGKIREQSAIKIQAAVRGWMARLRTASITRDTFDKTFPPVTVTAVTDGSVIKPVGSVLKAYKAAKRFLLFVNVRRDSARFERMIRYLVASLDSELPGVSYIGVFLNKEHSVAWIRHVKQLLTEVSSKTFCEQFNV